jgi:hypothetical protein
MNTSITFWIFYSILSLYLALLLYFSDMKKADQIFHSFLGNFYIFIYTYMISSDIKFSIAFNCFGYFISLYKN